MKRLLPILSFLFIANISYSQLYIDGATLNIANDAELYLEGDAESSGIVINNGKIFLNGNWVNNNKYTANGKFYLIGSNQTIDNQNDTIAFLYIDSNTDGDKQLLSPCYISDSLILNNGKIISTQSNKLTLCPKAKTTLGNEFSYVNGFLYADINSNEAYFPIGTDDIFSPIELLNINSTNATIGYKAYSPFPEDVSFSRSVDFLIGETYWEQSLLNGNLEYAQYAIPYDDMVEIPDGRILNVLSAESELGTYDKAGYDEEATSIIEQSYIVSSDTIKGRFIAPGIYIKAAWEFLYVPNALTSQAPDAEDQTIKVYGGILIPEGFYFCVKNQWGNIVFETNSLDEMETTGWHGTNQKTGKREVTGQYYFLIKGVGRDGKSYQNAGQLWIID